MADDVIRLTFGMSSTRVDADIFEEVQDALDDLLEDDWDIIAWSRSAGTRFLVHATVECRSIQSDSALALRILPLGQMMDDMSDQRNKWLAPKGEGSYHKAKARLDKWIKNMWPENMPEEEVEERKAPRMSVITKTPTNEVLDIFGLMGDERDSDGNPIKLFTLGSSEA